MSAWLCTDCCLFYSECAFLTRVADTLVVQSYCLFHTEVDIKSLMCSVGSRQPSYRPDGLGEYVNAVVVST